jgi:hypothetical protein
MDDNLLRLKARKPVLSSKANWFLLGQCALLVLPMVIFCAILLGLVNYYQWHRHHVPLSGLDLKSDFSNSTFYVDYSATRLLLVASLSSSTVFVFMGSFMTLLSFPLAADMIRNSREPFLDMLPKSYQLALLIDLLDGKIRALWPWLTGLWKRTEKRTRGSWTLEVSACLLMFTIFLGSVYLTAQSA